MTSSKKTPNQALRPRRKKRSNTATPQKIKMIDPFTLPPINPYTDPKTPSARFISLLALA